MLFGLGCAVGVVASAGVLVLLLAALSDTVRSVLLGWFNRR